MNWRIYWLKMFRRRRKYLMKSYIGILKVEQVGTKATKVDFTVNLGNIFRTYGSALYSAASMANSRIFKIVLR